MDFELIDKILRKDFAVSRQRIDAVNPRSIADAGFGGHSNGAIRRNFHFRFDNVLLPISLAGRDVAGQDKV